MAFFDGTPPLASPSLSPCIAVDPLSRFLIIDFRLGSAKCTDPHVFVLIGSVNRDIDVLVLTRGSVKALATTVRDIVCYKNIYPTRISRSRRRGKFFTRVTNFENNL